MKETLILAFISMFASSAYACSVTSESYVKLAISTVEEKIFSYGTKTIDENLSGAVISNCRDTAAKRRFVMITFGPDVTEADDSIQGTNFDRAFSSNESCSIHNTPLSKIQSRADLKSDFDNKWKFINKCVEITVVELGPRPLSYPSDQSGCEITRLSSQSAVFNGGFCFFKPFPESQLNISFGVKDECKNLKGFKDYGVELQELGVGINYYTSSAYKDDINDLSAFGTSSMRISINPDRSLLVPSEDFGILRPTFPGDYPLSDIHFGKISIKDQGQKLLINTPLIVNNFCKKVEKKGLVSSVCNYATPYVGEVNLFNSKGKVEATWFDGGIAPSQWQGIINGQGKNLNKDILKAGENYKVEITFSDPNFEFNSFKNNIVSKFSTIYRHFPSLFSGQGVTDIPDFGSIGEIDGMLEAGGISEIVFPTNIGDLNNQRKRLNGYFSTSMYPPLYTQACQTETGKCEKVGKPFVRLIAKFKVNDDYSISEIEVERVSKLLGSYKRKITEQPEYICN